MNLQLEKEIEDIRGKIRIFSYGDKKINLVEIKKGFARGGHYHTFESEHIMIQGKIEYREENITTKQEQIKIIISPDIIRVSPNVAHLLIALEDVVFVEVFDKDYYATNYTKYRQIVEEKMKIYKQE